MTTKTDNKYIEGIGRRKTSIARVRMTPSTKESIVINNKSVADYFKTNESQKIVFSALRDLEISDKFEIVAKIIGGGIKSQAESFRLGLSRALVEYNEELRKNLKKLGYLKRDPRVKERKKFGLKKARKAPQWSKR
ncbi:MAG TPA: 30S ribosomal protein S9 [Candidatus Paceibacterota bacterium]|nr:30S ribosomal protein S9 [Candidatus Paceibacterota bacterium]HMP18749.1 30S ribosomal protein S9 [Candidatus Paceibacterota bacterium]HMP85310.1 30S ribosomal protein S9 [Candidatus Paceibacterota bacterium]